MAANFDLRHAQTWNRIHSSLFVLPVPGNMGVAVGIALLSCIRAEMSCLLAEIHVITLFQPPSWIFDFGFHLGVLLIAPLKSFTPKTWVVAVRILFLASLEAEKPLGCNFTPPPFNTNVKKITFNIWGLKHNAHKWMNDCKRLLAEIKNKKLHTKNNINNIKQYIYQRCYKV